MSTLAVGTIQSNTAQPPTVLSTSNIEIGKFCLAWVNFNGTGTIAIRTSFNVTSITDGGTGTYTVNFTQPFSDADYCVVSAGRYMSGTAAASSDGLVSQDSSVTATTSSFGIMTVAKDNSSRQDNAYVSIAVFR